MTISYVLRLTHLVRVMLIIGIGDTAANAIWWIVELPDNFSDDMTDVWLAMCAPDDPKDCYALSQKIMMQSPEDVESTTSSTFTTLVETPVIISTLTATFTTSFTSAPSGQYSSTQAEDISDTHSNNTLWVGVVAGLAVVCGAMVLSLAGFCFYRNRTSSRKEHQDVPVFNSNSVRSLAEHTEPSPPFTPEMGMSRQFPDSKPAITAHQPLTALPSTEERSTPHTSVVSELA